MSRIITFGEIMGRLAAPGFKRFQQAMPGTLEATFAGAEATVAVSIAYLGGDAAFVTALPDHAIADACVANLRGLGVDTRHILRTPQGRLGLYFLEQGANQRAGNVIYDREGASVAITPPEAYDWAAIFAGAEWFLISGITPAISGNAAAVASMAMHQASQRGVRVACDMNFRSKLWRWEPSTEPRELAARTMRGLMPLVDLFIGGREDASEMLGIQVHEDATDPLLDLSRQIVAAYPRITRVAMTLREGVSATHNNWGGLLYDAALDQAFLAPLMEGRYQPYQITDIVDRLGGGDTFTAGLLFALTTPELAQPAKALEFAVAAGCLAHSIEGDFNYSTREEIEALVAGASSGR
ncbi:MAG: kdgK 2, partial [Verrucomicrobiaceae bacterium]|nr:kdgK 2 [Verrucomicrobiaceae bacterium]